MTRSAQALSESALMQTTQPMNASLIEHAPPVPHPIDNDIYPPDLGETTRQLTHDLLKQIKPELDIRTTWLAYRDSTLPPDAENRVHSAPMISSLIEHFTGHLSWTDNEVQGLYPEPLATAPTPVIEPLGRAAILTLFDQVSQQLEPLYRQKLADYWGAALPAGKTRRAEFIAEKILCLKSECEIQVSLGQMTVSHYSMLSAALDLCTADTTDDVQPHSVYSLATSFSAGEPVALPGAFVITRRLRVQPAQTDDEEPEDVLLFTLQDGLEGFSSFKQMNDSLVQRGSEPLYRQRLSGQLTGDEPEPPMTGELQWRYTAMAGNFLNLLLTLQIISQQSLFTQAVQRARAERLDEAFFEQLIFRLLRPELNFDNRQHLDRMDAELIQPHMPEWWKTMGQEQRKQWLEHAKRFGEAVLRIQRSSKDHFDRPDTDSRMYLERYIDQQLHDALKHAAVQLAPEHIMVSITYRVSPETLDIPGAPVIPRTSTVTMSLKQLVHSSAHRTRAEHAMQISAGDRNGVTITQVGRRFVTELVEIVQDPQHLDSYLDRQLKSSPYARQLKQSHKEMLESQMRMTLLEIEQQGFSLKGMEWIKAVLEAPAPENRPPVNGERIEVRFFSVNQLKMTNVMLIAPAEKFDKGPLVLCTLGATDGVIFRWFNSLYHLTTRFLEEAPFQRYLIQQIPVARRMETLRAMKYEKEAKHWRPPEIFTQLSPIPIPARLLRPVTFIAQSKDFYEEGHEARINQLIQEAKRRMGPTQGAGQSGSNFNLFASIAILFLPDPIMMPVALGLGLYSLWSGFSKLEKNDIEGATEEFLNAIGYLATAVFGRLALSLKIASSAIRRPNLVRRIGRDGQVQIGYLMSHSGAPRFAKPELTVAMDPKRFVTIEIGTDTGYVNQRANLFGHSRLYRRHPIDANLLVHEHEYALRTTNGNWKTVSNEIPRISKKALRRARLQLSGLLTDWPAASQEASAAERLTFETEYVALSRASNAENFPEIVAYAEGGSTDINPILRRGARNARTRRFLQQFYRLKEWHGTAFRATYVSTEALACLERETGAVFTDNGVQSASVSRANAVRWSQDGFVNSNATAENHPVFFIFAPAVPKKNLFTGFLGDHVAIAPGTPLQLGATQRLNCQVFAWFDVPEQILGSTYDIYTGEQERWV
ncbi:Uncharacterized protein ALO83_00222 [Pseudomonas cannabina pv. alisalensis]|uniref:Dermonecrotic toxin N-terminal domain-containing protein n=2 Tax=Pseudomonas cannabina TaxID=86840 RepID=A0A3M3QVY2_PSECA|nr:Uncharacterized protein ALO83_00222 [Pseudomonas cannabina pv. alisalensis]RMN76230.1 hypothetical protein ALQ52_03104 [Pseudomonas cannabina pv. alisalensis]RMN79002.1 hypothetical protein ALQ53_00299 [Pseudomonas cannabina]RMN88230.1 hypothetical protein ALQ51_04167 [Pseudomonas cannabina]